MILVDVTYSVESSRKVHYHFLFIAYVLSLLSMVGIVVLSKYFMGVYEIHLTNVYQAP